MLKKSMEKKGKSSLWENSWDSRLWENWKIFI